MHTNAIVRQRINVLQRRHQIVRVQRRRLADFPHPVFPNHHAVNVSAQDDREMTPKRANHPDRFFRLNQSVNRRFLVRHFLNDRRDRPRQVIR